MKAKAIKGENVESLSAALKESLDDGFSPTLAIVFLSVKQDREAICRLLDEKNIAIFGASTAGEFIDGEVGKGSVVVLLLHIHPSLFRIRFVEIGEDNLAELAQQIGRQGKQTFAKPAFLLSYSGLYTDGELLVNEIEKTAGSDAVIFGGMAADDLAFKETFVFTNGQAGNKAILVMLVDNDRITLDGHALSGWKPVGTERVITKSKANVVYTMDNEPALDVVMKYLGVTPGTPNEVNDTLMLMGSYFPILLQDADGNVVTRTSMFANVEERNLTFSGNVPQGAKFRFALPPDFEVVDEVIAQSAELKKSALPKADALIMFSCIARYITLGPMISEEIDGVRKIWDAPLIGFFSYGEIGKAFGGRHAYYNNTCCLVALKEKEAEERIEKV